MIFTSLEFVVFFALVALLYFWARRENARHSILLVASSAFYGFWDVRFLALLWLAIGIAFVGALAVVRWPEHRKRSAGLSVFSLLALLGVFKYFDFFVLSARRASAAIGLDPGDVAFSVVLPVGISFYIFQAISYVVDVYRGDVAPESRLSRVGLYISFFPQLVAGPIIRAATFLPQLDGERRHGAGRYLQSLREVLQGFVYKSVFADNLARIVDSGFGDISAQANSDLIAAAVGFYGQIYFDFAGYSLMAIGIARLLGYDFPVNFDFPYRSVSIAEFWRRWHISLSGWLRDYLYIPLGGNRHGTLMRYRNLMLTMLLGGLWHGASWAFVVWGGLHGLALVLHRIYTSSAAKRRLASLPARLRLGSAWLSTQLFVLLSWIPFRLNEVGEALEVLSAFAGIRESTAAPRIGSAWILLILPVLADTFALAALDRKRTEAPEDGAAPLACYVILGALFAVALVLIPIQTEPFIYFQF